MTNKFYALLTGSKKTVQRTNEKVFDKKSKKFFTQVVDTEVSKPTTLVVPLEGAETRSQARVEAEKLSKHYGLKLQGVHSFQ